MLHWHSRLLLWGMAWIFLSTSNYSLSKCQYFGAIHVIYINQLGYSCQNPPTSRISANNTNMGVWEPCMAAATLYVMTEAWCPTWHMLLCRKACALPEKKERKMTLRNYSWYLLHLKCYLISKSNIILITKYTIYII